MNSHPTLDPNPADDDARRQTRRRLLLIFGIMLLMLLLGVVPVFILLGGARSPLGEMLGFGDSVPTATRSFISPVDVQPSEGLREAGVNVQVSGISSTSSGSILSHSESRGFGLRITASKEPIEPEDLAFILIDDRDKIIAEGRLKLPNRLDAGESGEAQVQVNLQDDDGNPAKLIIRRHDEP
jgi:hypothetical protein